MLTFAHLSDIHLDGGERAAERALRVMGYLNQLPLAAVLVTGDIADHGDPGEYEQARAVLSSPHPVLTCPGNHDRRAAFCKILTDRDGGDLPVNQEHKLGGAIFALCDSSIPGRDDGRLSDETIGWLAAVLDRAPAGVPVFVCCHHPPAELGLAYVDPIRLLDEHRLADLIRAHPQVTAMLCGHAHTPAATTFAERPLLIAPGVTSTVKARWEPGAEIDPGLPPAFALHMLGDDGRLTTHYRVVP